MFKKFYYKVKSYCILQKRKKYIKKLQRRLINKNFTLITNNCTGGVIYNRLGLKFLSPTINLWFKEEDYLKFIYNLKEYVEQGVLSLIEQTEYHYPVGKLTAPCGEIMIYFMHYESFDSAKEKWLERCKRIVWDNVYYIMELKPEATQEHVDKFNNLPKENKLIFSLCMDCDSPYFVKIDINMDYRNGLSLEYQSKTSEKKWLDEVDYVSFINKGKN